MVTIDINCDLGEGNTQQDCEQDALLMPFISRCNIACGGHAGNELTIRESLQNAKSNHLKIGAHPGYPDKENFGRRSINFPTDQLKQSLVSQIDLLLDIAEQENIEVDHIKFHGALYNDIENDPILAKEIASIIKQTYPSKKLLGLAEGELQQVCNDLDIEFLAEGFIDRSYLSNGKLTPRSEPGAVIENQIDNVNQAIALAINKSIRTSDNRAISPQVDTICLHGDNPQAIPLIKKICTEFEKLDIAIR